MPPRNPPWPLRSLQYFLRLFLPPVPLLLRLGLVLPLSALVACLALKNCWHQLLGKD
jgi:hypothetical protein